MYIHSKKGAPYVNGLCLGAAKLGAVHHSLEMAWIQRQIRAVAHHDSVVHIFAQLGAGEAKGRARAREEGEGSALDEAAGELHAAGRAISINE